MLQSHHVVSVSSLVLNASIAEMPVQGSLRGLYFIIISLSCTEQGDRLSSEGERPES